MSETNNFDVVVVGAGIAGLAAAYAARKKGLSVQVLEASDRAGGVIRSEFRDGYLLELGPNTVIATPELTALVDELGLAPETIFADSHIPRYIQKGGRLHAVPLSPAAFFTSDILSLGGRLRLMAEPLIPRRRNSSDESLSSFVRRRLGWEVAERLVAPLVRGVWAGDTEQLSAEAAFPKFVAMEREGPGLLRSVMRSRATGNGSRAPKMGLMSFRRGLATLPRALAETLGDSIRYHAMVHDLHFAPASGGGLEWTVKIKDATYVAKNVVLTVPAMESARMISAFALEAAQALLNIPYVPLAVIHLLCPRGDVAHPLDGFGFLVSPSEESSILGCVWSSRIYRGRAPEGMELFTVFAGGADRPEITQMPDDQVMQDAVRDLQPILGLRGKQGAGAIFRYDRAIPQYTLGHGQRMETLRKAEEKFPGLRLAGNYRGGIAVGEVVRNAGRLF